MIDITLTLDNPLAIYNAMSKIKNIDRSDYFNNYYLEIEQRIKELTPQK